MSIEEELHKIQRADALSQQIISYARNTLYVNLRFMENALSRLVFRPYNGTIGTDMCSLYYDSRFVLKDFHACDKMIARRYLHVIMHCIFRHAFVGPSVRIPVWDLACDIAVEHMIQELNLQCIDRTCETQQNSVLQHLQSKLKYMTAEMIYQHYTNKGITDKQCEDLRKAFQLDDHAAWYQSQQSAASGTGNGQGDSQDQKKGNTPDNSQDNENDNESIPDSEGAAMSREEAEQVWKKLSQQIQTDLETFAKQQGIGSGSMLQNLTAVNRERCDYTEFLRKFSVYGEVMKIDDDEFDYNFYTYGLNLYGNMPLVEPLEYKEVKRVKEFVIAIDTSGSVSGETVQKFIQKTYNILKQQDSFFTKVNIHIIQCDAEIQDDAKITSQEEFDKYLESMQLRGFGGTDFRPVFRYVDELIRQKEFTNLKGMIYFTDGYGDFPARQPDYQTAFVFLDDEYNNYEVPVWAMRVILQTEEIEL